MSITWSVLVEVLLLMQSLFVTRAGNDEEEQQLTESTRDEEFLLEDAETPLDSAPDGPSDTEGARRRRSSFKSQPLQVKQKGTVANVTNASRWTFLDPKVNGKFPEWHVQAFDKSWKFTFGNIGEGRDDLALKGVVDEKDKVRAC